MVLLHNFLHKNKSSKKNLNVDLVIRTRIAEVKNFKRLNDTFEDTVISLFEKFFINPYQPVKELLGEYPTQFDREMISFFDRKKKSSEQDDVFNSITPIFSTYVKNGLLNEAQELWKRILIPVYEWEKKTRKRIHKGSIFYFWAQPEDIKLVPPHAIQYAKIQYEPVSIADHMLAKIQTDIDAYLYEKAKK